MTDRRRAWTITGTLWLATEFFVAYEIVPASVLPLVRAGLGVGPAAVGWLVSVFLLGMAAFSLPSGFAIDRVDDRRAILGSTAVLLLSVVWAWWAAEAGGYLSLVGARFVGGAAQVALWTASINVVGATAPPDREGTAIAVIATGVPGGFALGHLTGPVLSAAVGWTGTMLVYGALGTAAIGAFWIASRGVRVSVEAPAPTTAELGVVLRDRAVWAVGGLAFAAFSLNLLFNSWLPTYFVERFDLSLAGGGALAAGFPLVGALARFAGGVASDRFFDGRRTPIVFGSFLVVTPLIPLIVVVDAVPVLFGVLVVAGIVTQLGLVLLLPLVRELVAGNVAATALAVLNTVGFLGAFSAPILAGVLIERAGFGAAFGYATVLAAGGVLVARTVAEPE